MEVDPACEQKLVRAREGILNLLRTKRPRFVPAFELMTVRGNTISVSVPTTELREEILRNKTGMLMRIAELAGISGSHRTGGDRQRGDQGRAPDQTGRQSETHDGENPLIAELRKALDLEVE